MGKKILLAEDSSTIRKMFELAFAKSDISLDMVDNGVDAVRIARETSPDLVIADVTLPERDGFQVAKEISGTGKGHGCPVLILSGTLSPFDDEKFRKCGAKGVLFKPFDSKELAAKVRELLNSAVKPAPAEAEKEKPAVPPGGAWDFSDVTEEAAKAGGGAPSSVAPDGESSLGEFDISLEEIESPSAPVPEEIPGGARDAAEPEAVHIEDDPFRDAPPAVTDISSAVEAMEEEGDLEEVEQLAASAESAEQAGSAPSAEDAPRDLFSGRAQEIFEKVAADTVEKVVWEFMERFSAEFSERIRESVEAVAWEVIPPTAEALIREEIARIREKTEKKSS